MTADTAKQYNRDRKIRRVNAHENDNPGKHRHRRPPECLRRPACTAGGYGDSREHPAPGLRGRHALFRYGPRLQRQRGEAGKRLCGAVSDPARSDLYRHQDPGEDPGGLPDTARDLFEASEDGLHRHLPVPLRRHLLAAGRRKRHVRMYAGGKGSRENPPHRHHSPQAGRGKGGH